MADLRTALSEALDGVEVTPAATVEEAVSRSPAESTEQPAPTVSRDEAGRFAPKETKPEAAEAAPVEAPPEIQRPSTWRKEYWPLYDKLALGQSLTPDEAKKLADYTNEREGQFKAGVSTYKAEAEKSKAIWDAIAPFMPELQRHNIPADRWIANLANAHRVLAFGSPAEKRDMVARLAAEYQVPLEQATAAAQADPQAQWLVNQVRSVSGELQQMKAASQQQEQAKLLDDIRRFEQEKDPQGKPLRPFFEQVRDQMAGLLQHGMAQSLQEAYDQAVWMKPDVRDKMRSLAPATNTAQAAAVVAKAKAAAVSPKSTSPGKSDDAQPKGRRETLMAQMEAIAGSGRV